MFIIYLISQEKIRHSQIYNEEQIQVVFERDIQPLFDERKKFLQESIIDRIEV